MKKTIARHTRILSLLLVLFLVVGLLPTGALALSRLEIPEIAETVDETAEDLILTPGAIEDLKLEEADLSGRAPLTANKQGVDARSVLTQASDSAWSAEEVDYVESVARMLTTQEGVIGMDDISDDESVFVFVWLQELPAALKRVYSSEGMSVASYSGASSNAQLARNIIRSLGDTSGGAARTMSATQIEIEYEYFEVFAGFAVKATKSVVDIIASLPGVYAVTEVSYYMMDYVADPDYTTPGNASAREIMEIADLHQVDIDGTGIKVGVIDSGIDATHPDLADAYKGGYNFADKTTDMTKQDGNHGTHVSGTIASQGVVSSLGVAPGVDLYMAQVFSQQRPNSANSADTAAAIEDYTKDGGYLPKVDIVNMSMGNQYNSAYLSEDHFVRNNAVIAGVLIVCSGGNNAYPEENTTDRRNYTLGSGGVSLPLSVAASQYGGDALINYDMTAQGNSIISATVENSDASLSGVFRNGSFGSQTTRTVTYNASNSGQDPNIFLTSTYYGTYTRYPLVNVEGKGYELYYACGSAGEMSDDELLALKALQSNSLIGKILVVNRGQSFTDYLGEALRLGAGAVIVLNRDESPIGNMVIGNASAVDMPVFSAPVSCKEKLLSVVTAGGTAYLEPGAINKVHQALEPADFSSIGPVNETAHIKPDVMAPGWSILSTSLNGGYELMGGTSMASPWVAGVAALVKQQHKEAAPAEIKARIMNTANPDLIKPLSTRLSNPNAYFNAAGTETSVFEQGAGFVNPKRAIYEDIYITVLNEGIPTGADDKSVMTAQMASFSFGNTEAGTTSSTLTATVHGADMYTIDVVYNNDTRYSRSSDGIVEVGYEINGNSFNVWLDISEDASTDAAEGNLYEGYIIVTAGEATYTLPWATRVGDAPEMREDDWLIFPDRPIQATYNVANQDWSPYSSQNYIYFSFDGEGLADTVKLRYVPYAPIPGSGQYYLDILLINVNNTNAPAYRYPILLTGSYVYPAGLALSDLIVTDGRIYEVATTARANARNANGNWAAAASNIAAGSYYIGFEFNDGEESYLNYYLQLGVTFSNTRPVLRVEDVAITSNRNTYHEVGYAAEEATVNGSIYSAAINAAANAGKTGFWWAGGYLLDYGVILPLDQSFNVLMDFGTEVECLYNDYVGPYICDEDGNFSLTFPVQPDGYFFPETFSASGAVYATDAFGMGLLGYTADGPAIMDIGCMKSFQWGPMIVKAAPEVVVTSAELANGTLTAQFEMQDGTIPAVIDADKLTAELFKDGEFDQALTDFVYDAETGIATWAFEQYKLKAFEPWILTATVTYEEFYITTSVDSNEAESIYIAVLDAEAVVTKLNGNKNDLTITVTETYTDGSVETFTETFSISNNAAGTYLVDVYTVYVDTKGNDQIRDCYIVE